jgi:hypothetical protein
MPQPTRATGPNGRLHRDQVHAHGQHGQRSAVREHARSHQSSDRTAQVPALAPVERLLRQAEAAIAPPADLDDHERRWRSRIDRHEVELTTADANMTTEDRPALRRERQCDGGLGVIPSPLLRRPRAGHATEGATRRSPPTYPADVSSSGSPGPTAAHSSVCSTSAHEAKVRRWIGVVPCSRRPARCSGAA